MHRTTLVLLANHSVQGLYLQYQGWGAFGSATPAHEQGVVGLIKAAWQLHPWAASEIQDMDGGNDCETYNMSLLYVDWVHTVCAWTVRHACAHTWRAQRVQPSPPDQVPSE